MLCAGSMGGSRMRQSGGVGAAAIFRGSVKAGLRLPGGTAANDTPHGHTHVYPPNTELTAYNII